MRYPKFISPGDAVGFAAPAFACATEPYFTAFNNSLTKWKEKGFRIKLGTNCYAEKGIGISNTPEKCAEELMEMMQDPKADCVISCGGGELMCEIVPYGGYRSNLWSLCGGVWHGAMASSGHRCL